jgi:hypothetical protein
MGNEIQIKMTVNETFDSLYKLGYFLVDLNSICNFSYKINRQSIENAKKQKKYSFGITSRCLNKDSLDIIKLEKFSQGSFTAVFVAPLIVGIILLLIDKYINKDRNQKKIEIITNNVTINNIVINNYNNNLSFTENKKNILLELKDRNILTQNSILYDKDGDKILLHNIERIKGQLIDENW